MEIYKSRVAQFSQVASTLTKKYNSISISRLLAMVLFFVSIYYYLKTNALLYSLAAVFFLVLFIILMRLHTSINTKRKINKALIDINTNEISYLEGKAIPFENGIEFNEDKDDFFIISNRSVFFISITTVSIFSRFS